MRFGIEDYQTLSKVCVFAKQKQGCTEACHALKEQPETDADFFSKIMTGDKSWYYGYDPKTKQQSNQWKNAISPWPETARQMKRNIKIMIIHFFDVR